jgi:NAD(P)-dependent dehydrogenase (short-subunit alcohol dehydrogenase family)
MTNNSINDSYINKYRLKNKNAIVTGGAGIIGHHFCSGLAESGANIVVADINLDSAIILATELKKKYEIDSIGIECDVSNKSSVENMLTKAVEKFGEVNILVNNAASKSSNLESFFAPYEDYSLSQWREIMSVNIDGMFLVSQAVGRQMVSQQKGGSIIQIGSIYGAYAPDNRIYNNARYLGVSINTPAVYSASKAAVIGLSKYLSTYWAKSNIRVNCLCPGGVESGQSEEFIKAYSERVPLSRMGKPQEMVGALLFLASDASSYITGQDFLIDGGLSSW